MIKKTTTAIFKEEGKERKKELIGGLPLSVGETMIIRKESSSLNWTVIDKEVEYINNGEDQIVNVTYIFEKV